MYFQSLQISGPSRKDAGSSGCGRQPPGRPGTALDELVVTRGGKSSRWYIFPMEEASSRPAGPEQPWGAGRPPGEGRAADGTSSPWRWLAAARPARSSPGELGGHQGSGEQAAVLSVAWIRPGCPGAALGSWEAARGAASRRLYSLWPGSARAVLERPWGTGEAARKWRAVGRTLLPIEAAASAGRRGRPKEDRELKKRISLSALPSIYEGIQKIAYVERKSVSELMEEMMEDYQKRHRDKLDEFRELRGETE